MRDRGPNDANSVESWNGTKPLRFAGLVLDLDACTLHREPDVAALAERGGAVSDRALQGEAIALTRGEFALLRVFVTRPGRVLSRDMVLNALGDRRFEPFDRSVDQQVARLRRKIEPDPKEPRLIVTVPGEGYRFDGLTKTLRPEPKPPMAIPTSESAERRPEPDPARPVEEAKPPEGAGGFMPKPETPAPPPTPSPSLPSGQALPHKGEGGAATPPASDFRARFALLGAAALLVVIAAGAWSFLAQPAFFASTPAEPARLSLVVLPFVNLSGDDSQDYIVDALTDQLTTSIARWPGSIVIARSTAFTFKGKPVDAKALGKELGVRYILEGSVQPTGPAARVNSQLIEAESGAHVWADQFDTTRADLLQTQDEIVTRIAGAMFLKRFVAEAARLKRKPPANPDAEDLAFQCVAIRIKSKGPFGAKDEPGFPLCEQALAIDPNNVVALVTLSEKYWSPSVNGRSADPEGDLKRGEELVDKALTVDPNYAYAHHWKAIILSFQGRTDEAIAEDELALSLAPSVVEANLTLGNLYVRLGQFEKGLELIDKALRLSPRDPSVYYWYSAKASALFALKRYDEAIDWGRRSTMIEPTYPYANGTLAAALALTGRAAEAHEVVQRLASLPPAGLKTIAAFNAVKARITSQHADPRFLEFWDRRIEGMRKAGVPEE